MRKIVAEKLTDQISDWGHRGLIDDELLAVLKSRYSAEVTRGRILLRWLGFLAVFMLGMSVLGAIGIAMGELALYIAPILTAGIACFTWTRGVKMATDPEQHYPTSGAVLVTVGLLAGFASLVMLIPLFDIPAYNNLVPYMMFATGAVAIFTAYRHGLRWPLALGVLLLFHGLGNMHSYGGHGSYFLGIRDERITVIAALISITFGMWHEKTLEKDLNRREVGFGFIYIIFGLFYANLSLWFLSLPGGQLELVLLFSAACVAQIVAGGKFHDGRFIGFGIVFLSIDMYTRMFENFWDELSKGAFFLLSGGFALAVGIVLERRAKKVKAEAGV